MGLLMHFYAGNGSDIGLAFSEGDYDKLKSSSIAMADFSLHLHPMDLDILTEECCKLFNNDPLWLHDNCIKNVGGDEECSADIVDPKLVQIISSIETNQINLLANNWIKGIAEVHKENNIEITPDMTKAIEELIIVCKKALEENKDVVHTWSL